MCAFSFHWPPACSRGPVIVFLGWLPIKLLQSDLERLPPPSPSGCCGVDKSRTALARPAPLLRPLPPLPPPPPPREVSGGKRRARGRGGAGLRALSTRLAPPGHAATPTACAGPSGPGWEGQAPEGHLTLSLFSFHREEAGEEPTSPVTFIHAAPPGRCSPAPSSPAPLLWCVTRAFTPRDRLSFTLAPMSSPPSLPTLGPADCSRPCVPRGLAVRPSGRRSQPPCSWSSPLPHLPVPMELGSTRRSGCWEVRKGPLRPSWLHSVSHACL